MDDNQNDAGINLDEATDPEDCGLDFEQFNLHSEVDNMVSRMKNDRFILEGLALQGQMTVIYAKPNAGKTLLVMWMLAKAARSGEIDGSTVYYINADDYENGLIEKIKIAKESGFKMLAPNHLGFKTSMFEAILKDKIRKDTCSGVVVILDTVKKFTDLMNKSTSSQFFEVLRGFVSKGGTAILLAHVNKRRDEEKKVIYGGTSDLVDDSDCVYTLDDIAFDTLNLTKTVQFENIKARGNVELKAAFSYSGNIAQDSYSDLMLSVKKLSKDDCFEASRMKAAQALFVANSEAIEAIKEILKPGTRTQSDIVKEAIEAGISRRKIIKALKDHDANNKDLPPEYKLWKSTSTAIKNRKEYTLQSIWEST